MGSSSVICGYVCVQFGLMCLLSSQTDDKSEESCVGGEKKEEGGKNHSKHSVVKILYTKYALQ